MDSLTAWRCIAEADPAAIAPSVYRGALLGALEKINLLCEDFARLSQRAEEQRMADDAEISLLKADIERLRAAIRRHRDAKGPDSPDEALWAVLN